MVPETMIQPITGKILRRDIRQVESVYKGEKIVFDMPGWYPEDKDDDDGIFSQEDMKFSDAALRILKERVRQKELYAQDKEEATA